MTTRITKKVLELHKQQYNMETLKEHIFAVPLLDILKFQKIDETFAVQFILNKSYQLLEEEENLTLYDVIHFQPHLNPKKLFFLYSMQHTDNYNHAFPNFEEYSNF